MEVRRNLGQATCAVIDDPLRLCSGWRPGTVGHLIRVFERYPLNVDNSQETDVWTRFTHGLCVGRSDCIKWSAPKVSGEFEDHLPVHRVFVNPTGTTSFYSNVEFLALSQTSGRPSLSRARSPHSS